MVFEHRDPYLVEAVVGGLAVTLGLALSWCAHAFPTFCKPGSFD